MTEPYIEITKLKAFAEIQKAGIDCSVDYGSTSKELARHLKNTIDVLVKTVSDYAMFCNSLEENDEASKK